MKRKLIGIALVISLIGSPSLVLAATAQEQYVSALRTLIALLLQQISVLQKQLAEQNATTTQQIAIKQNATSTTVILPELPATSTPQQTIVIPQTPVQQPVQQNVVKQPTQKTVEYFVDNVGNKIETGVYQKENLRASENQCKDSKCVKLVSYLRGSMWAADKNKYFAQPDIWTDSFSRDEISSVTVTTTEITLTKSMSSILDVYVTQKYQNSSEDLKAKVDAAKAPYLEILSTTYKIK